MELNVPTIAQRKAARRSQVLTTDSATTAPTTEPLQQPPPVETQSALPETKPESSTPPIIRSEVPIDKESLLALAKSMGLELAVPKKIWIKHSYSVTPESKEKFSKYCETLGIKMQDGLEDALQDWFTKKQSEFSAVSQVKKT